MLRCYVLQAGCVVSLCLQFVRWLVRMVLKIQTNFHETFGRGRQWDKKQPDSGPSDLESAMSENVKLICNSISMPSRGTSAMLVLLSDTSSKPINTGKMCS